MSLLPLVVSSSVVSFTTLVLIDYLIFGIPLTAAVVEAFIATVLGHWLGLLWLYRLGKG